jgi:hypothetical protein
VIGLKRFFTTGSSFGSPPGGELVASALVASPPPTAGSVVDEAIRQTASSAAASCSRVIVRIAQYDSKTSPPRIEEVFGDSPRELIERLAARTHHVAREMGGSVPYVVIRELVENLIHAHFRDVVISVLDDGHILRFSDAGPGIADVERALRPGFSTADDDARRFIKGVGSGLPVAVECVAFAGGSIAIDRNLSGGAVVTVRMPGVRNEPTTSSPGDGRMRPSGAARHEDVSTTSAESPALGSVDPSADAVPLPAPAGHRLSDRQKQTLLLVMETGAIGPSGISRELSVALSTAHRDLALLEAEGLIRADATGKRTLTALGISYIEGLF